MEESIEEIISIIIDTFCVPVSMQMIPHFAAGAGLRGVLSFHEGKSLHLFFFLSFSILYKHKNTIADLNIIFLSNF